MSQAVIILAVVVILSITGLALTASQQQGAVLVRPMVGDECQRLRCPDGLAPAKIDQFEGHVYCGCGTYARGEAPGSEFEFTINNAHWSAVSP